MAIIDFKKEDFVKGDFDDYQVEYTQDQVGMGSNLIVETLDEEGKYQVVLVPIRRHDDKILICFSEPTNGRLLFEK
ncbi:glutathione synthase [Chryseobacterium sp.]|uniref:glutathione synthase n=1 Tax=Chryseobacterium sp. TaxID=1871047 RepID=UPI00388D3A4C